MLFYILVLLFVILFYVFFTWNDYYWEKRGIPFKKPNFFFGNFKDALLVKRHFALLYSDLYNEFAKAGYCGFFRLRAPMLVLRDLEHVKNVLVKDFTSFSENEFHVDPEKDPILGDNPFFRSGEDWKNTRSQWSSSMTSSRVKAMHQAMVEKGNLMVEYLSNHTEESTEPLETRDLASKYLTDVIVTSVFGLKVNSFEDPNNIFRKLASQIFSNDFWTGLIFFSSLITPWLNEYFRFSFVTKEVEKEVLAISEHIKNNRKIYGFSSNDFFEAIIQENESKGKSIHQAPNSSIASRVFGFLSDGIETSSLVIAFTLYELAANPQIQSRLREELNESAIENDGKLSFEQINSFTYLDMVISEVIRLYPPGVAVQRVCTKSYTFPPPIKGGKSFVCPKGMPVIIPTHAIHHDPNIYPDPEKFDPERFNEDNKGQIPKFAFIPFGEGPRICVGMRLALAQTKVGIASILRNFELRVSPKTKPRPLPLDPSSLLARALGDIWVTFHKIQ